MIVPVEDGTTIMPLGCMVQGVADLIFLAEEEISEMTDIANADTIRGFEVGVVAVGTFEVSRYRPHSRLHEPVTTLQDHLYDDSKIVVVSVVYIFTLG